MGPEQICELVDANIASRVQKIIVLLFDFIIKNQNYANNQQPVTP